MNNKNILLGLGAVAAFFLANSNVNANDTDGFYNPNSPGPNVDLNKPLGGGSISDYLPNEFGVTPIDGITPNDFRNNGTFGVCEGTEDKEMDGAIRCWTIGGRSFYIADMVNIAKLRPIFFYQQLRWVAASEYQNAIDYIEARTAENNSGSGGGGIKWGKIIAISAQVAKAAVDIFKANEGG